MVIFFVGRVVSHDPYAVGSEVQVGKPQNDMVYALLGLCKCFRIKKVFDEIASVEDNTGCFVVGDVEEVEVPASDRVFDVIYDGHVEAAGCFKVGIKCEKSDEED